MKFATHVVLFGQDKWIMKNIENSYPHVDRIYIAYSEKPWGYNPNARNEYKNPFDLDIIKNSKFYDKIEIIEGDWLREEDQRNACVDKAIADGMDYLMIHDADEFYFHNDFSKMKDFICKTPNSDYYTVPWISFWKDLEHITLSEHGSEIVGYPQVVINLNNKIRFVNMRNPSGKFKTQIDNGVVCYHMSYALTDDELLDKLKTWGHHKDFDIHKWYNSVWLKWEPDMINLHPVYPSGWSKVINYTGSLPEVLVK